MFLGFKIGVGRTYYQEVRYRGVRESTIGVYLVLLFLLFLIHAVHDSALCRHTLSRSFVDLIAIFVVRAPVK